MTQHYLLFFHNIFLADLVLPKLHAQNVYFQQNVLYTNYQNASSIHVVGSFHIKQNMPAYDSLSIRYTLTSQIYT